MFSHAFSETGTDHCFTFGSQLKKGQKLEVYGIFLVEVNVKILGQREMGSLIYHPALPPGNASPPH